MKSEIVKLMVLLIPVSFLITPLAFSAPKTESKQKPKTDMADIWGYRRGPKAPGSPERRAEEALNRTPEQMINEALEMQKKAEAKRLQTEADLN